MNVSNATAPNDILFRVLFDDQAYMWATMQSHLAAVSGGEFFTEQQLSSEMDEWKTVTAERINTYIRTKENEQ